MICQIHKKCLLAEVIQQSRSCQQIGLAGFDVVTIEQAVADLLESKRSANKREVYVKSLGSYLRRFYDGRADRPLSEFTTADVEDWLAQFQCSYSRQTWLNRISTLFSWAKRRGIAPVNPCDQIERVVVDKKPPKILSVDQSKILLASCPSVCRPWLVLAMFAGIRPDGELMEVEWKDINLETKTVKINAPKVRKHCRIVPLEPIAVGLLAQHPLRSGKIAPSKSTLRRFKRRMRSVLGFEVWPQDVLRHTAASHLMALHKDAGKVAAILGNSASIMLTHYHEPVSQEECEKFWSLQR